MILRNLKLYTLSTNKYSTLSFSQKIKKIKMENFIKDLISCKMCLGKLENPVILPCGESVCKKHENEFRRSETQTCKLCNKDHILSENENFIMNKSISALLASEINNLNFGDAYIMTQLSIMKLKMKIETYENIKIGEDFLYDYFSNIKNSINLEYDEIVVELQKFRDSLLDEVDEYKSKCYSSIVDLDFNSIKETTKILEKMKAEIKEWEFKLKRLIIDNKLWKNIQIQADKHILEVDDFINELESIQLFDKNYKKTFENKFLNIRSLFVKSLKYIENLFNLKSFV